jgi:hypothetical protein
MAAHHPAHGDATTRRKNHPIKPAKMNNNEPRKHGKSVREKICMAQIESITLFTGLHQWRIKNIFTALRQSTVGDLVLQLTTVRPYFTGPILGGKSRPKPSF